MLSGTHYAPAGAYIAICLNKIIETMIVTSIIYTAAILHLVSGLEQAINKWSGIFNLR